MGRPCDGLIHAVPASQVLAVRKPCCLEAARIKAALQQRRAER